MEQSFIRGVEDIGSSSLETIRNLIRSQCPREMGGASALCSGSSWKLSSQIGNLRPRMHRTLCRHIRCQKDSYHTLPTTGGTKAQSLVLVKPCNRKNKTKQQRQQNKQTKNQRESRWKLLQKAITDRKKKRQFSVLTVKSC